jgi:hypothetical protein
MRQDFMGITRFDAIAGYVAELYARMYMSMCMRGALITPIT